MSVLVYEGLPVRMRYRDDDDDDDNCYGDDGDENDDDSNLDTSDICQS